MLFFILILMSFSFSNEELVDGVLAVVENNHILFSEVLGESRMLAEQKNINPQTSPMLFQSVFDSVLAFGVSEDLTSSFIVSTLIFVFSDSVEFSSTVS